MENHFKASKTVLIFNGAQVLVGIMRSLNTATEYSGGNLQSLSYACSGRYISTGGYYYRFISEDVEITLEDIGTLRLKDYDRLCGDDSRNYRSVREMAHKRKAHYSKKTSKERDNED